ncbi:hypothetical protein GGQ74_002698 [Desulfobaculum xiamenense]|uniref:Uncharacterized protein n=1 Tax=Desulfobaculum xiamenense TaxID=995050 RepID=A0A846QV64_9BACT|nr:hypothetical protein [Desulfobaculum xiamenense]NJB69004.1 hypothetical protein [Desulfobaculum xiamenense]
MAEELNERAELEALSKEEILDCFEGALFEHVTEGEEMPELAELTIALGLKGFVNAKLAHREKDELIDLFLGGDKAIVELIDHAAEQGLLEE